MNKKIVDMQPIELVTDLFRLAALRFPDNVAILHGFHRLTYRDLNKSANKLADLLSKLSVENEEVISVLLPPGAGLVTTMLATFKTATVYMPLDTSFSHKRLKEIKRHTESRILISENSMRPVIKALYEQSVISFSVVIFLDQHTIVSVEAGTDEDTVSSRLLHDLSTNEPSVNISPETACYIFYTSGSSGEGKPILGCHKGLSHFIQWEIRQLNLNSTFRFGQLSQITFDASLRDMLTPLAVGATLCVPFPEEKINMALLLQWLRTNDISLVSTVPSFFRLIVRHLAESGKQANLPALKYVLLAGDVLYAKDVLAWRAVAGTTGQLINMYGTSETTMAKTFHIIDEIPEDPSAIIHAGKPIDDTFVAIINDDRLCRIGEIGEIFIITPYKTKGYYKDETLTKAIFVQNPLQKTIQLAHKTGDFGRYLKDRSIEVIGRKDDQVKVGGIRLELKEVERAVLAVPEITETVIVVQKNAINEQEQICYYTGNVSEHQLQEALRQHLNENIIPAYFVKLKSFPLNINGKIDKNALPSPDNLVLLESDYKPPYTTTERALVSLWQEVLGLNKIGVASPFFKIGGTSLKAIQIISRIFNQFNVLVKIKDIFTNPTIEKLAVFIDRSSEKTYTSIPVVTRQENYELSHSQKRLWIINQLRPEDTAYNIFEGYQIIGSVDHNALNEAFISLFNRHESLRTIFTIVDGEPRQKIIDIGPYKLPVYDLREKDNCEQELNRIGNAEAYHRFDLTTWPLFRVRLVRVEDDKHILFLAMHHIISDGWSLQIVFKELLQSYNNIKSGASKQHAPLRIQYKDYAAWHNTLMNDTVSQRARDYWLRQFSEEILPLDFPRELGTRTNNSDEGKLIRFSVNGNTKNQIDVLCSQREVSVYMFLAGVINLLLFKYTGRQKLVLGTVVAGRSHEDLEEQVGYYLNTLPLKFSFSPNQSFDSFLQNVRETTLSAFEHQHYPFDQLIDDIQSSKAQTRLPLFQTGFSWQNYMDHSNGSSWIADGLEIQQLEEMNFSVKHDFWFYGMEMGRKLDFIIRYNSTLFSETVIHQMAADFTAICETAVSSPALDIVSIVGGHAGENGQLFEEHINKVIDETF